MPDTQRAKAAKLVDSDVLGLGASTQKTRKTTNPVVQNNMSRFGAASPQPRLTPTSIPFAKGGKAKSSAGKMQKAAQVAGMLSALTQGAGGPPAGPPMGAPAMAGPPMGAPPGMKRGGKAYAKGGKVHGDEAADKKLFGKMFKAAEKKEGPEKMAIGGKCAKCGMKHGGACKMATGGHMAPRNKQGRVGFAMGGVGKVRKNQATPAGKPIAQKRSSTNNLI